jgi:p-hydroxybenzoate 3-monooxygenase
LAAQRTQVGIVGAGPAGLLLGHLLKRTGIDSVVLETRSRDYVERRVRAGVLEQQTVDLLDELGLGERMRREGLVHDGIELRFGGESHRIDMTALTGRAITVYGQHEVVKDMIASRVASGQSLLFEVADVSLHGVESDAPAIRYTHDGAEHELRCDLIAGCDGFHGISRLAIPARVLSTFERVYPFGWLGILAKAAPSSQELIYCLHEDGFALQSMRSPEISRLYLQCDPSDPIEDWPDDRIWSELERRLGGVSEGAIIEKGITPMRAFVSEPMQWGRLFLAGDAAHIVPPTGAKGLNLAAADVRVLAAGIERLLCHGDGTELERYSARCLERVWRIQHFSNWMTSMLHRVGDDPFEYRLQLARLDEVCTSSSAATTLADYYTGLPFAEAV